MSANDMRAWEIDARNLPEHSSNPIHTDAGAQAQGFERALVAGVTTSVYVAHPAVAAWGDAWASGGAMQIRFRSPLFDLERVQIIPRHDGEATGNVWHVDAVVQRHPTPLVSATLYGSSCDLAPRSTYSSSDSSKAVDEQLETLYCVLDGEFGSRYASRAGDDAVLSNGVVHPSTWLALANRMFHQQLVRGSWIHTRSAMWLHSLARDGELAIVDANVVARFQRSGERAVAAVTVRVDDRAVATLEHEAIIDLSSR